MPLTLENTPLPVLLLGLFAPVSLFVLIPVLMLVSGSYAAQLTFILHSYSSTILTFIGAVRWAFIIALSEVKENRMSPTFTNLGMAVAPSIVGWVGLLLQGSAGFVLLLGGFVICLMQDVSSDLYAPYYRSKNIIVEMLAILSLLSCKFLG